MTHQKPKIITVKPRKRAGTFNSFHNRYDPIYVDNGDSQTLMRELDDPMVAAADEQQIWTIVEGDNGKLYLTPGRSRVNRIAYALTKHQWNNTELTNPGYSY